ncbi:MAG: hypothetical protein J7J92_03635 [Candidatus Aenigmarchaeota archaeon]|nr:hypothetical protein [Candidatus Aenigmarchaeota archaeon]
MRKKEIFINKKFLDENYCGDNTIFSLKIPLSRFGYIPKDGGNLDIGERGVREFLLVYERKIPSPKDEPELFSAPHYKQIVSLTATPCGTNGIENFWVSEINELWLKYPNATVILATRNEDDKFRKENEEWSEKIEAIRIDFD